MKNKKRLLCTIVFMLSALFLVFAVSEESVCAAVDAYPTKPIRFIVPLAPGSSVDMMGRLLAAKLGERLGKPVIVENHGGAGGVLGAELASKATPDGYTFLAIGAFYGTNPAFYKLPFDPVKDFTPVAKMGKGTMALIVHPSVPANTVKEFVALAKQKPGQIVWTASGIGSSQHMAGELFKMRAGIDVKIVQFSGGGTPSITDLIGGHSEATVITIARVLAHIKAGKLRALGVVGKKRSSFLPDVPTIEESGVKGYEVSGWWGLLAPAGTPAPIVDRLSGEIKTILTTEELKKFFQGEGAEMDYLGSREFASFIADDINQWKQVVKEAKIEVVK